MRVIINADDFGLSEDTYRATVECFDQGILTSATIMPLMPASDMAIGYAREHPEFSFGAHLVFCRDTYERPASDPARICHLTDRDGNFMNSNVVRLKALAGLIPRKEIECEVKAQLAYFHDSGLRLSHVDSHGHIHKMGPFPEAIARSLGHFGISRVRAVQNVFVKNHYSSPTFWLGGYWGRQIRKRFVTTDHFFMMRDHDNLDWIQENSQWFGRLMTRCKGGVLEAGFHPGANEQWRNVEREAAQQFAHEVSRNHIPVMNWNDLKDE